MRFLRSNTKSRVTLALGFVAALGACRMDMHDAPYIEPYETSSLYGNGMGMRLPVKDTVARGDLRDNEALFTGREKGELVTKLPIGVDERVLARGRQRFEIYCTPCHDRTGSGNGLVVQRGFPQPTSFHADRLRQSPVGYFFEVMTKGYGRMFDYKERITPEDRWAIVAYIRALQLSQEVNVKDLSPAEREAFEKSLTHTPGQPVTDHPAPAQPVTGQPEQHGGTP